jgi:hypothetical protein
MWTATVFYQPNPFRPPCWSPVKLDNICYNLTLKIVPNPGLFNFNVEIPHINIENIGECFMCLYLKISVFFVKPIKAV